MLSDKELKKKFKVETSKNFKKFYPIKTLEEYGFTRRQCKRCNTNFWSTIERDFCENPECSGGFRFIGNSPAKNKLGYTEVWKKFAKIFKDFNYTEIKRYPVVARWNPTTNFTIASIAAFQPYVVSGEVDPPANPLVIPQFCLRFGDVDNVGITGHNVGFVMMGQHAFVKPKYYDKEQYFKQIYHWIDKGLGINKDELTFHEDAWAGGGNFGSCIEFFSRGLEIGNQVYMEYEQTPTGSKELNIKVLDMGEGQERAAWFTQGTSTNYDATFPDVMKKLYKVTNIKVDNELMKKFLPYSSYLNLDEVEDINKAWKFVANNVNETTDSLKEKILPLAALYSIAEHSRALLVAVNDGGLPSNTGGGYNLRMIYRRMLNFIDKYQFPLDINEIVNWHADELKKLFPELKENVNDVNKILDYEKKRFKENKERSKQIVIKIAGTRLDENKLIELYDSQGINPELIKEEAEKLGKEVKIPDNFYALISERHENVENKTATIKESKLDLDDVKETKLLFYDDEKRVQFEGKVIKIIGNNIILDQTLFYATSGGQLHDIGTLDDNEVVDVIKQGKIIIHVMKNKPKFKVNDKVDGKINLARRMQLMQHHTGTHILNGAARKILGNHIWQHGASKDIDKARLDITHYENLTEEQVKKIEDYANYIIDSKITIKKSFMLRNEAEKKYGVTIYQGGVAPGKYLRIVNINNFDVEACGGTHADNTNEVENIKVIKTSKIQDGIVRIEFVAGKRSKQVKGKDEELAEKIAGLLDSTIEEIPGRVEELFDKWKDIVKKGKKEIFKLSSNKKFKGDVIKEAAKILKTQPEHLEKTIKRFLDEIKKEL
ncbi:MAG TPA: alanine--tRNA ligase [Candidatus Nanoarchaeia archaeon]|nr:alanine--tRNA ligase [Candidatus Nanoarchaeia archaeon]